MANATNLHLSFHWPWVTVEQERENICTWDNVWLGSGAAVSNRPFCVLESSSCKGKNCVNVCGIVPVVTVISKCKIYPLGVLTAGAHRAVL